MTDDKVDKTRIEVGSTCSSWPLGMDSQKPTTVRMISAFRSTVLGPTISRSLSSIAAASDCSGSSSDLHWVCWCHRLERRH